MSLEKALRLPRLEPAERLRRGIILDMNGYIHTPTLTHNQPSQPVSHACEAVDSQLHGCVDGSDNRLGKFLFQIIEATRGGMPARDGNRSPRDDRSWGSRAKDFVICAEAALRGKKGDPYPLNNSSLGRWVG